MKKIIGISLLLIILMLTAQTASAKVVTIKEPLDIKNGMYIVGLTDGYPIEYYNEATGQFEGILPDILNVISEESDMNFYYLNSNGEDREKYAQDIKAELITVYTEGYNAGYFPNVMPVYSFEIPDGKMTAGWRYSDNANSLNVAEIHKQILKLTEEQKNGVVIKYSGMEKEQSDSISPIIIAVISVLLAATLIFLIVLFIKYKKQIYLTEITDFFTGIGNLRYFENEFSRITDKLEDNYFIAYFVIDSAHLQAYYENSYFMDVAKYTSKTLESFAEEDEIVARITENGFAFVFISETEEIAMARIKEILDKLSLYFEEETEQQSFFHAVAYNLKNKDTNLELLLFNLRKSCSRLIDENKVFSLCDPDMMNRISEEKSYVEQILNGFEENEFKLYLQFIVDNTTKKTVFAEALSRWDRGEQGIVYPGSYIGVMEKAGIITSLDYYMFEQTCMQLHKWNHTEFGHIPISCNFTRITLSEKDFVEHITEIANRYVFEKEKLIIEITEDAIEKNRDLAINNILKCKKLGFKIALDDLGSGYTSLTNLCDYPIDIVKMDRSILLKTDKENGRQLFSGTVALAHNLGLKIVCEGVETNEHNDFVSSTDCDLIQGWFYSKVLSVKESENYFRSRENL